VIDEELKTQQAQRCTGAGTTSSRSTVIPRPKPVRADVHNALGEENLS